MQHNSKQAHTAQQSNELIKLLLLLCFYNVLFAPSYSEVKTRDVKREPENR